MRGIIYQGWCWKLDDEDDFDMDEEEIDEERAISPKAKKTSSLKKASKLEVDVKVVIPTFGESFDIEKLDDWIEHLETYFTLYDYLSKEKLSFVKLKLSNHALTW